jgi:hypothetical protein
MLLSRAINFNKINYLNVFLVSRKSNFNDNAESLEKPAPLKTTSGAIVGG